VAGSAVALLQQREFRHARGLPLRRIILQSSLYNQLLY